MFLFFVCFPTLTNSLTQAGCPTTHFNSDTNYLEWVADTTSERLSPTKLHPLQTPVTSPGHPYFWYINWGSPNPLLRFDNFLNWLTELRKTFYLQLTVCYKGYCSGAAWRKRCTGQGMGMWGEEGTRGASWPSPGAPPSQDLHVFTNPEALWTLWLIGGPSM